MIWTINWQIRKRDKESRDALYATKYFINIWFFFVHSDLRKN